MRKGIILAGGTGSRLFPVTKGISKQLLPVYDKPMIYYPLSTLMLAGIRQILLIVNPLDKLNFQKLLGDGSQLGIEITYAIQAKPDGIAQAFIIAESFLKKCPAALILGDNLYHGSQLSEQLIESNNNLEKSTVFACRVKDPQRYGVVCFDKKGMVIDIEEKPSKPKSNHVITGLYFYDDSIVEKAKQIKPSARNELEITDINNLYLKEKSLSTTIMARGTAWFDTGTFESLLDASTFIHTIESRLGLKVGCPEEVAWRKKWIGDNQLIELANSQKKSGYGEYLINLIKD